MKRVLAALGCGVLMLTSCARPGVGALQPDATLRVMTYNIFAGNDLTRQSNLERIGALADSLEVDVLLLQEVDRMTGRSGGVDQAAAIAGRARMHFVFGASMQFDGGEFGNAIVSRWPVQRFHVQPLGTGPAPDSGAATAEPRSLLHAVLATSAGAVHVVVTHLDQRADPRARNAQLLELLAYLAEAVPDGEPIVLGGDMNARPETPEVRALGMSFTDAWKGCGTGNGYTFRSDNPDRRIDYIMLAGLECTAAAVPATQLSDHRPVVVEVRPRS
jgi:endonuclease/exonuclease/phosphatase family metal-dependent hydrolase